MPGPSCSTCARPDLADIHRAVDATNVSAAARRFGLVRPTLILHLKHRDESPAPARATAGLVQIQKGAPAEQVPPVPERPPPKPPLPGQLPLDDLDGRIQQLAGAADTLRAAASEGPLRDRAVALNAARSTIATLAELHEKREQGREPELLTSKAWLTVRTAIVDELQSHPAALVAVAARLRQLEGA